MGCVLRALGEVAHFEDVSLPSNPSSNWLSTFFCLSFRDLPP